MATKTKQDKSDLKCLVLQMAVEMFWGDQNLLNASAKIIYLMHSFFFLLMSCLTGEVELNPPVLRSVSKY